MVTEKAKYKTWIRKKKIFIFLLTSILLITIALIRFNPFLSIISIFLAIPFIYITFLLFYSYYQFSDFGGKYQSQIHNLIVKQISRISSGKLLDIGTGSGSLIINCAKKLPLLSLTGIDYWGDRWEYSKKQCETNAQIESVADRIRFVKGSASNLPFNDGEFDVLVSCLTFHEVKDEKDKIKVLKEAFRVLKEGGEFVFLDLFLDKNIFGEYIKLESSIKSLGISELEAKKIDELIYLPKLLLHRKILGNGVVVVGRK